MIMRSAANSGSNVPRILEYHLLSVFYLMFQYLIRSGQGLGKARNFIKRRLQRRRFPVSIT